MEVYVPQGYDKLPITSIKTFMPFIVLKLQFLKETET